MRSQPVVLKGRTVALSSGDEIHQWEELGDDGVAIVSVDGEGNEVGRVAAIRAPGHAAASLSAWTSPSWRRRGLAHAGVDVALRWASDHQVPYLVTDVARDAVDADAFAHACGLIVAARTDDAGRRLTVLVPQ